MKLLNTKLILSAVGIALLATPAFAQQAPRYPSNRAGAQMQYQGRPGGTYNAYGSDSTNGNSYRVPTAEW
ncbi:MAG: hypothetical protein WBF58_20255 [Xanthobacteraceae bacterium]